MIKQFPTIYWINLNRSDVRRKVIESAFKKHKLQNVRVEAVDGKSKPNLIKYTKPVVPKQSLNVGEVATAISHLTAIKNAYDLGEKLVIIMEDDVTLDFLDHWPHKLSEMIKELPKIWHTLQLSYCARQPLADKIINMYYNKRKKTVKRTQNQIGGAFAYCINREGMKHLIDKHWRSDGVWCFDGSCYSGYYSSGSLVFGVTDRVFTSTIPLFGYQGIDSTIHADHLKFHREHLQWIQKQWLKIKRLAF